MGPMEIVGADDRGMAVCQLSGEINFSDPWTFFLSSDRGSKRRRGGCRGPMGLSGKSNHVMRVVHFMNASLQIEY
jgi:hypothetical protein